MSKNTDLGNLVNGLFVSSTKNVGIGTSSPRAKLDVIGDVYSGSSFWVGDNNGLFFGDLTSGASYAYITGVGSTGASSNLSFSTNGAEKVRITSAGNVGIGTSSPASKLTVEVGNVTSAGQWTSSAIALTNPTNIGSYSQISFGYTPSTTNASAYMGFVSTNQGANGFGDLVFGTRAVNTDTQPSERMRITSGGNVSIGNNRGYSQLTVSEYSTGEPNRELDVNCGTSGMVRIFAIDRVASAGISLVLNDPGGNVLIGTQTNNGEKLYVSGSIRATGSITANSDARLKKNIERIENALEKVGKISGYTYNTIYDEDRHAGLIAQEVELVLPEIVNAGTDTYKGIEYGNISALLVEAIKELSAEVQLLKNK